MKRNIVLVGMMGSGKSHIGRKLAARLQWQFVDTDRRIERFVGKSIAEFYAEQGEAAFRERELNVLQQVSRYHVRYSTTGSNNPANIQPLTVYTSKGQVALAHNGNLTNTRTLRTELDDGGATFQTTMDSEIIVNLISRSRKDTVEEQIMFRQPRMLLLNRAKMLRNIFAGKVLRLLLKPMDWLPAKE